MAKPTEKDWEDVRAKSEIALRAIENYVFCLAKVIKSPSHENTGALSVARDEITALTLEFLKSEGL